MCECVCIPLSLQVQVVLVDPPFQHLRHPDIYKQKIQHNYKINRAFRRSESESWLTLDPFGPGGPLCPWEQRTRQKDWLKSCLANVRSLFSLYKQILTLSPGSPGSPLAPYRTKPWHDIISVVSVCVCVWVMLVALMLISYTHFVTFDSSWSLISFTTLKYFL